MALVEAIARVDELIEKLKRGELISAGEPPAPSAAAPPPAPANPKPKAEKKAKEKKEEEGGAPAAAAATSGGGGAPAEGAELLSRARLLVARVAEVDLLDNSDKLYRLQLDVGGDERVQVVAGLRQYVERDALLGRLVVCITNLKPARLAGVDSRAMVLAASVAAPGDGGGAKEAVAPLAPPPGAAPGDRVFLEGAAPAGEPPKVLKSDAWRRVVGGLAVRGGAACFEGAPLAVVGGGRVAAPGMPDGAEIH